MDSTSAKTSLPSISVLERKPFRRLPELDAAAASEHTGPQLRPFPEERFARLNVEARDAAFSSP
jgi:hypothetical protein